MSTITDQTRAGLRQWIADVDDAASRLPVAGGLFARRWRVLIVEPGQMRYRDGRGEEAVLPARMTPAEAGPLIAALAQSGPLVLRFSSAMGFRRTARFPSAARGHLDEAARLALPRLSPLPAPDTAYALERDSLNETEGWIDVSLAMVRRTDLDHALARAAAMGLKPAAADLMRTDPDAAPVCDLREGRRTPPAGHSAFRWAIGAAALFLVAALGLTLDNQVRLEPRLAEIETPATIEATLQSAIVQARAKGAAGPVTIALADLARRLPDGAYATDIAFNNGSLRVSGLAWDAAATLSALANAPEFEGAAFSGATVRDEETGRERFDLTLRHVASGSEARP